MLLNLSVFVAGFICLILSVVIPLLIIAGSSWASWLSRCKSKYISIKFLHFAFYVFDIYICLVAVSILI